MRGSVATLDLSDKCLTNPEGAGEDFIGRAEAVSWRSAEGEGRDAANHRYVSIKGFLPAALVVTAVSVQVAPAAAAPKIPVLRGRTVAVADSTSFTTVRVPRPIDIAEGWEITSHGRGRLRGLVLTQVGENILDTPTYAMVFPGYCTTAGCGDPEERGGGSGFLTGTEDWNLPAGTYRMYVIADAARVRIEVGIDGYSGRTTIPVTQPAAVDFDSFRSHAITTPDGTIYAGGGFSELGGGVRGFATMKMWGLSNALGSPRPTAFQGCWYYDRSHPAPDHAFLPGCPGSGRTPGLHVIPDGSGYVYGLTALHPMPYGIGGHSVNAASGPFGGAAVWMPLTEALPEPAP